MGSKRFEDGTKERQMFQDFWQLCQKFWAVEGRDAYWEEALAETKKFSDKYRGDAFAEEVSVAFLRSLERRQEEGKAVPKRIKG